MRLLDDPFVSGLAGARFVRIQVSQDAPEVTLTASDVAALISDADFDFASVRLPEAHEAATSAFLVGGFYHAETLITYRYSFEDQNQKNVPAAMPQSAEWLEVAAEGSHDAEDVAEIGRIAFRFDRFHSDNNIDDALADLIKQEWSRNNVTGRAVGSVVVRSSEKRIVGFCGIVGSGGNYAIDLIAVHPQWQRRGIARTLMVGTLHSLSKRLAARELLVGTSRTNGASRALYETTGCREMKREVTLHWAAREIKL